MFGFGCRSCLSVESSSLALGTTCVYLLQYGMEDGGRFLFSIIAVKLTHVPFQTAVWAFPFMITTYTTEGRSG